MSIDSLDSGGGEGVEDFEEQNSEGPLAEVSQGIGIAVGEVFSEEPPLGPGGAWDDAAQEELEAGTLE